jgi:hypothetical protein
MAYTSKQDNEAETGYAFKVVYYMTHDDSRSCTLWVTRFKQEPDRIRFAEARVPCIAGLGSQGGNLFAQTITSIDLDKSLHEIFVYNVKMPKWYQTTKAEAEAVAAQEFHPERYDMPKEDLAEMELADAIAMASPESALAHQLISEELMRSVANVGLDRLQSRRREEAASAVER